jgi:hypothetical protein
MQKKKKKEGRKKKILEEQGRGTYTINTHTHIPSLYKLSSIVLIGKFIYSSSRFTKLKIFAWIMILIIRNLFLFILGLF